MVQMKRENMQNYEIVKSNLYPTWFRWNPQQ